MLKFILHQIGNQKRQNGWIFMELFVVFIFLWLVIDPIYVLLANRAIPAGYEQKGLYYVSLNELNPSHPSFSKEAGKDSIRMNNYRHQLDLLRQMPEIESFCIAPINTVPNSGSWSGSRLYTDTVGEAKDNWVHTQRFQSVHYQSGDFFRTYGIRDERTGEVLKADDDIRKIYISAYTAQRLFGKKDVVGKQVYDGEKFCTIGGVFADVKYSDFEQPYPLQIVLKSQIDSTIPVQLWKWYYCFVLRLKAGVDEDAFLKHFRQNVIPTLAIGNSYCTGLKSFSELSRKYAYSNGVSNKLRLQFALSGFALFCIFLGMLGTFWIRIKARRQEIGLMRSMGATNRRIIGQFLAEAWLLLTLAFIPALLVVMGYVYFNGMTAGNAFVMGHMTTYEVLNPDYWQNLAIPHFLIVSLICYLLLCVAALVGTLVPVRTTAKTLPAEALRDE